MAKTIYTQTFRAWLRASPKGTITELAQRLNTTPMALRQYTCGARQISSARALEIERAVEDMIASGHKVEPITAPELCSACAACPYARGE